MAEPAEIIAGKKTAAGDTSAEVETEDFAKDKYGNAALIKTKEKVDRSLTKVKELTANLVDQIVWIQGQLGLRLGNDAMCFFIVRQEYQTVQALLAVGDKVSKQMVKFAAGISKESIVDIQGFIRKVDQKIDSCSQQDVEVHVEQLFVVSSAEAGLPSLIEGTSRSGKTEDATRPQVLARAKGTVQTINSNSAQSMKIGLFCCI